MEALSNILYWLSSGLFIPVMLGTVIMFFYSIYMTGIFYSSYKEYARYNRSFRDLLRNAQYKDLILMLADKSQNSSFEISHFVQNIIKNHHSSAAMDGVLSDFELWADKKIGAYKTIAKLGPILGLMGTLIPMGPALAGLGQGDISSMSWNMQVAFATTVIGLFAGTIAFLLMQPYQRMLVRYLSDMELLIGYINEHQPKTIEHQHVLADLLTDKIESL